VFVAHASASSRVTNNALLATKSIEHVQPVTGVRARAIPSPFIWSAYYTERQAVGRRYGAAIGNVSQLQSGGSGLALPVDGCQERPQQVLRFLAERLCYRAKVNIAEQG